jgi:large subunit ribosomal protein L33
MVKMRSTESPYTYNTTKNKRTNPDRLELRKYDPVLRKHCLFKEQR